MAEQLQSKISHQVHSLIRAFGNRKKCIRLNITYDLVTLTVLRFGFGVIFCIIGGGLSLLLEVNPAG
jgi:hypothetical protein